MEFIGIIDGTRIRECPLIQNKAGHHRGIFNYRGSRSIAAFKLQRQARTRGQDVGHRRCDSRVTGAAASHIEFEGAVGGPQNRPGWIGRFHRASRGHAIVDNRHFDSMNARFSDDIVVSGVKVIAHFVGDSSK